MTEKKMGQIFDICDPRCIAFFNRYRTKKGFVKAFRRHFQKIVAYHATRLDAKESRSILAEGMKRTSIAILNQKAIKRLVLSTDTIEGSAQIQDNIGSYFEHNRFVTVGQLNFSIDKKLLLDECYHYLLFGPESLLPVADHLRQQLKQQFRQRLVAFGSPVILTVSVPVIDTDDIWLETLYEYLNGEWPETSLVIHTDLAIENLIALEILEEPIDYKGFIQM